MSRARQQSRSQGHSFEHKTGPTDSELTAGNVVFAGATTVETRVPQPGPNGTESTEVVIPFEGIAADGPVVLPLPGPTITAGTLPTEIDDFMLLADAVDAAVPADVPSNPAGPPFADGTGTLLPANTIGATLEPGIAGAGGAEGNPFDVKFAQVMIVLFA